MVSMRYTYLLTYLLRGIASSFQNDNFKSILCEVNLSP